MLLDRAFRVIAISMTNAIAAMLWKAVHKDLQAQVSERSKAGKEDANSNLCTTPGSKPAFFSSTKLLTALLLEIPVFVNKARRYRRQCQSRILPIEVAPSSPSGLSFPGAEL